MIIAEITIKHLLADSRTYVSYCDNIERYLLINSNIGKMDQKMRIMVSFTDIDLREVTKK